jgi:hypothetical protein
MAIVYFHLRGVVRKNQYGAKQQSKGRERSFSRTKFAGNAEASCAAGVQCEGEGF